MVLCIKHYKQIEQNGYFLDTKQRSKNDPNKIIKYNNYAEIVLYNNINQERARTKIDLEDVNRIKKYKWHLVNGYVCAYKENRKRIRLHRILLNLPKDKYVDHINGNTLDNRKENLRICTKRQNNLNKKLRKDNKSGVTGVFWANREGKWVANIWTNKKKKVLGYFSNKDKAVKTRKEAEKEYYKQYRYDYKSKEREC